MPMLCFSTIAPRLQPWSIYTSPRHPRFPQAHKHPLYAPCSRYPLHHAQHTFSIRPTCCTHRQLFHSTAVESHLRSLCADDAADAAYQLLAVSSPPPLPPTWPFVIHALASASIIGKALSRLVYRFGIIELLNLQPHNVEAIIQQLFHQLSLTHAQRKRILSNHPHILADDAGHFVATVQALRHSGLRTNQMRRIALRWPDVLQVRSTQIRRVCVYLTRPPLTFPPRLIVSLVCRAPWLLSRNIDDDVAPIVNLLDEYVPRKPLFNIFLAHPPLVSTRRETLLHSLHFLREVIQLSDGDRVAVVRSFPALLTCSVDSEMQPVFNFLTKELYISNSQVSKMVRAFPAILTLDVDAIMKPVVRYFRQTGVRNIARIVQRLPPVLGYDVETNVAPKMRFVLDELRLGTFHVLLFPGLFSYSLEKRIRPRTWFLMMLGLSISKIGLNRAVSLTDEDFCSRIAKVPVRVYESYYQLLFSRSIHEEAQGANVCVNGNEKGGNMKEEESVWGKKRFRTTLSHIPWEKLQ